MPPRRRYRRSYRNRASRLATYVQIARDVILALAALGAYIAYVQSGFIWQAVGLGMFLAASFLAVAVYWGISRTIHRRRAAANRQSTTKDGNKCEH